MSGVSSRSKPAQVISAGKTTSSSKRPRTITAATYPPRMTQIGHHDEAYRSTPLEQKLAWFQNAPGQSAVEPARQFMSGAASLYTDSDAQVRNTLRNLGADWTGDAATNAGAPSSAPPTGAQNTGASHGAGGETVEGYGESFESLRGKVHWDDPWAWGWNDTASAAASVATLNPTPVPGQPHCRLLHHGPAEPHQRRDGRRGVASAREADPHVGRVVPEHPARTGRPVAGASAAHPPRSGPVDNPPTPPASTGGGCGSASGRRRALRSVQALAGAGGAAAERRSRSASCRVRRGRHRAAASRGSARAGSRRGVGRREAAQAGGVGAGRPGGAAPGGGPAARSRRRARAAAAPRPCGRAPGGGAGAGRLDGRVGGGRDPGGVPGCDPRPAARRRHRTGPGGALAARTRLAPRRRPAGRLGGGVGGAPAGGDPAGGSGRSARRRPRGRRRRADGGTSSAAPDPSPA